MPVFARAQTLPPPELVHVGPPPPPKISADTCALSASQPDKLSYLSDVVRDCAAAPEAAPVVPVAAAPIAPVIGPPPPQVGPPAAVQAINPDEAELLLLQLVVSGEEMEDVLEARKTGGKFFIALSQLAHTLDFSINVQAKERTANGWFIREQNVFVLTPEKSVIKGKETALRPDDLFSDDSDIYVNIALLQQWFPINFAVDERRMTLDITTRQQLPFQERMLREKARKGLSQSKDNHPKEVNAKRLDQPYQAFGWPVTDVALNTSYDSKSTVRQADYSINSVGDFGYLTSRLFASGDLADDALTDARLSFGRDSLEQDLLGPLKASSFRFGDINSISILEVASAGQGRGITISSRALDRSDNFDFTNFIGDSQPGWEVELYRNGALIDAQVIGSDGRYEFKNVPVLFGNNQFRLAFYGPQGQVQEINKTINAASSLLEKGAVTYNFSADQKNESVFGITDSGTQAKGFRTAGEVEYGLTKSTTVVMGAARLPLQIGDHDYVTTGVRASLGNVLASIDGAYDVTNQGRNIRAAASTELSGTLLSLDQTFSKDFFSEQNTLFTNPVERETNVRADRQFGDTGASLQFNRKSYQDGRIEDRWQNQLSRLLFDRINVTHTLQYNINNAGLDDLRGTLFLRGYYRHVLLGGQYEYAVKPEQKPSSLRLTGLIPFTDKITDNVELRADLQGDTDNEISNTVTFDRDKYKISVVSRVNESGEYYGGLALNFSVGRVPQTDKWFTSSKSLAETGNIAVYPYIDKNYNMKHDAGESPPPGTKIKIGSQSYKIGKQGAAVATQLPTSLPVQVSLESENQQANPFWSAGAEAYSIVPRAGTVMSVDLPVFETSQIDGTVHAPEGVNIQGLVVELVSSEGQAVRSTRTAFDGYYLLESVMPGSYTIRISEESLKEKKLTLENAPTLTITTSDFFIKDIQLIDASAAEARPFVFITWEEMRVIWKSLTNFPPGVKSLMDAVNSALEGK